MQDDITDGVHWLIKQGVANPKKVVIYGASYGGYATLAGLTFAPDLYACGVDYVGISNLFTFLRTIPPYWEPTRSQLYAKVGDPKKDAKLLRAVSPVFHAARIKAPLLVAHGAHDPRVNINYITPIFLQVSWMSRIYDREFGFSLVSIVPLNRIKSFSISFT
jgi:dipeptidyl aminopeptidase/acylaminoacyl peptidase